MADLAALAAFVTARLAEEEAAAKAASGLAWMSVIHARVTEVDMVPAMNHLCRHDPARMLRDIEAKRKTIDAAIIAWNESCSPTDAFWSGLAPTLISLVKQMATVWNDHPDYDERWKP